MSNIFRLVVEQIFIDLTNSNLKFEYQKTTIFDNIKTRTMFFRLVVCIHMESSKWFRSIILKIYTIFEYVKIFANNLTYKNEY